jgi:mRNA interferase MazF
VIRRGDVVIVRFPYAGGSGAKVRPAVVVQCDRQNSQLRNTVLAMITGNTRLVGIEPSQFLIDPASSDGSSSGLTQASAVKCENLATIPQSDIIDNNGQLSSELRQRLDVSLKAALELA